MKLLFEERGTFEVAVFCGSCREYIGRIDSNDAISNAFSLARTHECKDDDE